MEYGIESVETDDGPIRILTQDTGRERLVLELEFLDAVIRLRNSNEEAFQVVWDLVDQLALVPTRVMA